MIEKEKFNPLIPKLLVSDFKVSIGFYVDVLGFKIMYQRENEDFAMIERQGSQIMLDQYNPESTRSWIAGALEQPFGRGLNLEIGSDDVKGLCECAKTTEATIFWPLEEKWYCVDDKKHGVRQFIVKDPDGYLLRFSETLGKRNIGV